MKSKSALFRDLCIQTYLNSDLTAEDVVEILIKNLREEPNNHEQFALPRQTAEGIIRNNFIRKYDNQGKYMTTLAPVVRKKPVIEHLLDVIEDNPAKTPDLTYAATLTKGDLDVYAEIFNIKLNRSMTKANMLTDFRAQLETPKED